MSAEEKNHSLTTRQRQEIDEQLVHHQRHRARHGRRVLVDEVRRQRLLSSHSTTPTSQCMRAASRPGCSLSNVPRMRFAFSTLPSFSASIIFHSISCTAELPVSLSLLPYGEIFSVKSSVFPPFDSRLSSTASFVNSISFISGSFSRLHATAMFFAVPTLSPVIIHT